jgi:hypothetical protein
MGARPTPRRAVVWLLLWLVPATLIAAPLIGATSATGADTGSTLDLVPAIAIWLAVLVVGWSLTALAASALGARHPAADDGKRQQGGL